MQQLGAKLYFPAVLLFIVSLAFIGTHISARSSQSLLTNLVWLLPVIYLFKFRYRFQPGEILLIVLGALLFISALLSYSLVPEGFDFKAFRHYWLYLLPLGLVPLLHIVHLKKEWLINLLILSGFLTLVVILRDLESDLVRGWSHGRPIPYGILSLSTAMMCVIFYFDRTLSNIQRIALLVASLIALASVIWSQTRGGWLYLVLWISFFAAFWLYKEKSLFKKIGVVSLFLSIFIIAYHAKLTYFIEARVLQATNDIERYIEDNDKRTSVGQRLELWKVSIHALADYPLFGNGGQALVVKRDELTAMGSVDVYRNLKHSHNDILWMAATRGLAGITILLLLYIALVRFYLKKLGSHETKLYAVAGLTSVLGAMVYGLTDIFMSMKITIGYFFILHAFLIRFCEQKISDAENSKLTLK
jgi:O-antigen ligase